MVASFTQRPSGTEIAKHAWDSTVSGVRAMPVLFLAAFFIAIILSLALNYSSLRHLTDPGHFPSLQGVAVMIAGILAWSALTAPVAVAMHRFVLLGQTTDNVLSFAPRHTKLFFLWAVALQLAYDAVQGIGGFLTVNPLGLTRIIATIVVVGVSVHLAMIFPAVAIEAGADDWQSRIAQSWRQMQGNAWLLIRAGIVAFLPVIILWVIVAIGMVLFGVIVGGVVGSVAPLALFPRLWLSAALAVITVLSIALGAALASWIYAWIRSNRQAQSAQTATSTVT